MCHLVLANLLFVCALSSAQADESQVLVHGQFTYTEQETNSFSAPYAGANSLPANAGAETADATLSLGWLIAPQVELWLAPELDQGFGLHDTLGLAGFSSGEAYKIGHKKPVLRSTRVLIRWNSEGSGESTETSEGMTNFKQTLNDHRWIVTAGKFSVVDVFDNSLYAHDPRNDFLNWSVIDTGSFDYAADAYGYTVGATVERVDGAFSNRVGLFEMSNIPNSEHIEPGLHEFEVVLESEWRFDTSDLPGHVFVTGFLNRARMASLSDLMNQPDGIALDPASMRHLNNRLGISANLEKALTPSLNAFLKVGHADGRYETYEFTDIDDTVSAGFTGLSPFKNRPSDRWGLSMVRNDISGERIRYLQQGGLGILIGDGQLPHPGAERITELFYNLSITSHWFLTFDAQRVNNPAYNRDRGPVTLGAIRLHGQF